MRIHVRKVDFSVINPDGIHVLTCAYLGGNVLGYFYGCGFKCPVYIYNESLNALPSSPWTPPTPKSSTGVQYVGSGLSPSLK